MQKTIGKSSLKKVTARSFGDGTSSQRILRDNCRRLRREHEASVLTMV
jgi:hypothetical protein